MAKIAVTKLEAELKRQRMSTGKLARRAKCDNGTASRIVRGERQPGVNLAVKIAKALGKSVEDLF